MTGVIKMFNEQRGFGFIYTDGEDIFFHVRNLNPQGIFPEVGMDVRFDVVKNEKGDQAINLEICMDTKKTKFIKFGNERIKASNIKSYGISNDSANYLAMVKQRDESIHDWASLLLAHPYNSVSAERSLENAEESKKALINSEAYELAMNNKLMYLYITTYQNDNYTFYQYNSEFDIYEKMDEIDEILC